MMSPDFIKITIQEPGQVVTTHENGVVYYLKGLCKMQVNGEWKDAVIYESITPKFATYCRAIDDFKKFTYHYNETFSGLR